ncbi:hypothetical protein Bca4012_101908 [Brassica carinata]|uniref:Uncharacterized protein n=2 Tax=Brassica TaxID=3705 RepID=A0A8X7TW38_BRACI|nr:PREDICTED: uncharacterized protein LOC106299433 [Brassica oleracea var. oleracea]XP_013590982.1 PREDICTED: uncharacterized protein LOC106299433 [Brassica oleracea var. oleracea]KAG2254211.1 hypothetical protein Bca52824_084347 [Brassica carinata]KAG2254328.1 hypothetical protein Bca52824_084464 [Brassica carinata]
MARRQLFQLQVFLVLAVLSIVIASKPVLVIARTDKPIDCETKGQQLNQISYLRRNEMDPKIRTRTRRLMNVVEINDYPGSGANSRHTRPYCPDC